MSKDKKINVEQNNLNAQSNNNVQEEDPIESPFWFWTWMGVLVLMFIGFALFHKYYVEGASQKDNTTPKANVESAEPTTDHPSVTK
jgi:hypothetical protein